MIRVAITIFISIFSLLPSSFEGMSFRKENSIIFDEVNVGVKTMNYFDPSRDRPVVVEVWYPTEEISTFFDTAEDPVWVHPTETRNAKISNKPKSYPLILMSHGNRGDRRERTWLADALVKKGYVVASVEHYGNSWKDYNPLSSLCFWERAKDISFALNEILKDESLNAQINQEKIGFVGYSMGGMTGLALAGAQASHLQEIAKVLISQLPGVPIEVLDTINFSEGEKNLSETRIKSFLLICPATFAYSQESLKTIKTPIGLIASLDDEVLPHKDHAQKILKSLVPKKLKLLRNKTSHYAFLNKMTKKGYELLQKIAPVDTDWTPIHKEATAFAIKYFDETLIQPKSE